MYVRGLRLPRKHLAITPCVKPEPSSVADEPSQRYRAQPLHKHQGPGYIWFVNDNSVLQPV